jgi:GrpB-like predicted nucleotidyltransferase (UPF0157 family)
MAGTQAEKTLTALAGEYLTAARLCLMGYMAVPTFKNFPGVDILAYNIATGRQFSLQVKTISESGSFIFGTYPLPKHKLDDKRITVWAHIRDKAKGEVDFFIAPFGKVARMAQTIHKRWYREKPQTRKLEGGLVNIIGSNDLKEFKDKWELLE